MNPSRCAVLALGGLLCVCQSAATATASSVEVVLAHHTEELSWTRDYEREGVDFTVYSKGPVPPVGSTILPNVGRESHTFLYHIVHRYRQLADWTVFSQAVRPSWGYHGGGDVSGHLSDNVEFSDYLRPFPDGHDAFFVLNAASQFPSARQTNRIGFMIKDLKESAVGKSQCPPGGTDGWTPWWWDDGHPHLWGKPEDVSMLKFYHRFIAQDDYTEQPLTLIFAQGARFAVSRQRIHSRPKEYYEALLQQLSRSAMPMEGYWMEASWYYVFHPEAVQSGHEPCVLPALPPPQAALTITNMQAETLRRAGENGLLLEEQDAESRLLSQAYANTTMQPTSVPDPTTASMTGAPATDTSMVSTTQPSTTQATFKVEGAITLVLSVSVEEFQRNAKVMTGLKNAIAAAAGSTVTPDMIEIIFEAVRRLKASSRRLSGSVRVRYIITLPQTTTSAEASSIATGITTKQTSELKTELDTALTNAGVSQSMVASVSDVTAVASSPSPPTTTQPEDLSFAHGLRLGLSVGVAMLIAGIAHAA